MGSAGMGFGSFMQGYQNTLLQRHALRQQQFNDSMNMATEYGNIADKHRQIIASIQAKPVWSDEDRAQMASSQQIINEAMQSAQQHTQDAEKSINQKIGGLAKLGSLIKGIGGNAQGISALRGAGAPATTPGATNVGTPQAPTSGGPAGPDSSGGMQQQPPQASDSSIAAGLPPPPAGVPATTPVALPTAAPASPVTAPLYTPSQPQHLLGPSTEIPGQPAPMPGAPGPAFQTLATPPGVSLPPPPAAAPASGGGTAPAGAPANAGAPSPTLPAGFNLNPYQQAQAEVARSQATAMAQIQTDARVREAYEQHKQELDLNEKDFDDNMMQPMKDAGFSDKMIQAARIEYKTAGKVKIPGLSGGQIVRSPQPVLGSDGKYYYVRSIINRETGDVTALAPELAGATTVQRNRSDAMNRLIQNKQVANPGMTDDQAETAVQKEQAQVFQDKATIVHLQVAREQDLVDIGKQQFQWKKDAQDLKKGGAMTTAQAGETMRHFDAMAQYELFSDPASRDKVTNGKTGDEIAQAIIERSKSLLAAAGFSRDDLLKQSTGKTPPTIQQQTEAAKQNLVAPPGGTTKKTGPIKPPG